MSLLTSYYNLLPFPGEEANNTPQYSEPIVEHTIHHCNRRVSFTAVDVLTCPNAIQNELQQLWSQPLTARQINVLTRQFQNFEDDLCHSFAINSFLTEERIDQFTVFTEKAFDQIHSSELKEKLAEQIHLRASKIGARDINLATKLYEKSIYLGNIRAKADLALQLLPHNLDHALKLLYEVLDKQELFSTKQILKLTTKFVVHLESLVIRGNNNAQIAINTIGEYGCSAAQFHRGRYFEKKNCNEAAYLCYTSIARDDKRSIELLKQEATFSAIAAKALKRIRR